MHDVCTCWDAPQSHQANSQPEHFEIHYLHSITFRHNIQTQKCTGLALSLPGSLSLPLNRSLPLSVSLPLIVSLSFSLGEGVLWGTERPRGICLSAECHLVVKAAMTHFF